MIAYVEASRLLGMGVPPIVLFATVMITAGLAGMRAGLVSAAFLCGYSIYAWLHSFGPPSRADNLGVVFVGILGLLVSAFVIGRATDRNRLLIRTRREAELTLRRSREDLEERIEERTVALRLSESRLLEAQRVAKIGNWEWDLVTGDVWWSAERYRLAGRTAETFRPTQESFYEALHPEDRQRIRQILEDSIAGREPCSMEFRTVLPDGSVRSLYVETELFCDQDERAVRLAGTTQDITERIELEREVVAAGEYERLRIGADLHDGLGQELTAVSLGLQFLYRRLTDEESPQAQTVKDLTTSTQGMIAEIRRIARQLSPVFSTELGLCSALRALSKEVSEHSGVQCRTFCSFDDDIHDVEIETHLYRIAQESINNALTHGGAQSIGLRYGRDGSSVFLEVVDDGTGIPDGDSRVDGLGLRSMLYRARMLHGRLEIGLRTEGGTRVLCSCPAASD